MTFDYYHKETKDLLQTKVTIPSTVGYASNQLAYYNSGRLSNIGWEYRIDYGIFRNRYGIPEQGLDRVSQLQYQPQRK